MKKSLRAKEIFCILRPGIDVFSIPGILLEPGSIFKLTSGHAGRRKHIFCICPDRILHRIDRAKKILTYISYCDTIIYIEVQCIAA